MDIKQTLLNFHETLKSNPELSDDELLNKFPELNKDSLSAAFDYSATLDSGKYKSEVEFEDKFPEFFPVKKKELDGQTLPEVTVKSTSKSQSQLGQPAQTPTSVSNSSLSVSQPSLATEVDYSPLSTEDLSNKYKELKTLADQYKSNIDKFKAEGDSGKIRLSGTAKEYDKIIGELNYVANMYNIKAKDTSLPKFDVIPPTGEPIVKDERQKASDILRVNLAALKEKSYLEAGDPNAKNKAIFEVNKSYNAINQSPDYSTALQNLGNLKQEVFNVTAADPESRDLLMQNLGEDAKGISTFLLKDRKAIENWQAQGLNPAQGVALDYIKVFQPEKYKAFQERATAAATGEMAGVGKQITNFELENTGIGILKTGLTERYNALQESIVKANRGELTAEESKKVKSDSENISKWLDYVDKLEQDQYTKYPEAISLEMDRVFQDVSKPTLGQGAKAVLNLANSISGTFNDGLNAIYSGLFLNDQERINNDLEILAKSNVENTLNYTTQNQSIINRPFLTTVSDDVKKKIDEIDNSSISDEEKYKQKFQILKQARKDGSIYTVVNPNKSKVNWTGEAMLNTVTSVAPQVIGAIVLSGTTGGYGAATKLGQLSNLFAVTAIQSYGQRFNQAKEEGSENPYFDAGVGTLIDAGTELFGNDIAQIKKVFGSGNAGKLLEKLSDGDWKRLMANKTGAFRNFGKVLLEQGKDVVTESGEEGLAQALDNLRQGKPIGEGMKETILSTSIGFLPLKIIGLPMAFKSANMVDKFNLYSAGFNKNTTIAGIDNQLKAGDINKEEADRRKGIVNQVNGIINSMPMFDVNGKPLSDDNKAKYVFNQYIKQNSKDTEGLPSSVVNNINQTAQQADAENGAILEGQSEVTIKSSKDAISKSAGQVEPTIGDIGQPQGVVQGQQEVGQGEGEQGQAAQPGANVSDSNISGEGQVAKPSDFGVSTIAKGFAELMDKAKKSLGINGISVDVYNQEDYDKIEKEGGKFIKSADGTAVGVLKPNGEIVSIVKSADSKQKNVAPAMIEKMKQLGGLFMDNFDIYLTKQYEKAGYKVVARLPFNEEFAPEGWDAEGSPLKNKPDVVFMAREDLAPDEVKVFDKNDYDGAKAYTEGLVKGATLPLQTISIDANNQADLGEVTVKKTIHKKVISDVNRAAQALAKVGIKFNVYQNAEEFTKATGQEKSTQGVFNDDNGTISINLSEINNSGDWNIAWHEGSHPVMNIIRNTNRPLYDKMAQGIADLAKKNPSIKAVAQWAGENYEGKETQVDESMVETIALIADNKIDLDAIPQGLRQDIIDFVNKVASYLGLDPILSDTSAKAFVEKAKEISNALKTGQDISEVVGAENVREYQNNLDTPEIVVAGEMNKTPQAKISDTPAIDVYESKETEKLPVKSIEDVYKKFDGKAVAINSDPTRVGELTLPSGKKIFMYGGPAYLSLKDNVDAGVGFATTQPSKVKTWSTYLKSVFGDKDGVTLVTTQAPTSMMANSYSLRYVLDAISTLPKSILKSKEFKDEFFGKDLVLLKDAFGEKGYNDFVNKYKKADLSDSKVIDGMISEMAYKVGDDNKPASFKARGAFVGNLLGGVALKADIKGVEGDKGYVSKKPTKFIAKQLFDRLGLNQEKLFYEIGEKSLVDLYMNEGKWGMAVAGFETKAGASIDPAGGVKHPLFNAKFPGSDAFLLDGAYEIDKLFAPQDIISSGGNPYTKSAAQMLAGSMYVMGDKTKGEKSFEYKPSPISGTKIQQKKSAVVLAEMESIVKTAKENGTYLKAPNGKATKLNPDQWAEVRTNNFKNWFGDWENDSVNASKVVDGNGEPRVVFHGTNANFDEFKKESLGSKNWMADSAYMGFFFAGDKKTSEAYTGMNSIDMAGISFGVYDDIINKYKPELDKASKAVSETYNTILAEEEAKAAMGLEDSVKTLRDQGLGEDLIQDLLKSLKDLRTDLQKVTDRAKEANDRNGNNDRLSEINKNIYAEIDAAWRQKTGANPKIMELFINVRNPLTVDYSNVEETELPKNIQEAIGTGKDGVVFNNLKDGAEDDDIFVAFEPNQIKSATDNTGEFSKASNKIQQKVGKVELPDTTIKQMTEDDKGNYLFYHYSPNSIKVIDPSKFGKNLATGKDERPGIGISMYYTRPDVREQGVPGDFGYVVRVNKNKVYPFNQDPLNLIEPAKRMFEKQFPGQAFDTNKQVAWVSKAAAGRGYPMTVAEWNIKGKKYLRAQTTEALKPEVYSKIKPGTINQVEINPSLEKFKPNVKKRGQTKASGLSLEDLKDFNNLPNVEWAVNTKYLPLSEFGIENLDKENVKTLATKLAEVDGPYQPILKAIAKTPNADKVKMYTLDRKNNTLGEVAGLYSRPRTMFDKPVIGITTDNYINQYAATVHEMLHWVTVDSVNKYKGTKEYKALQDIYDYLKATHPEIKGTKAAGDYYGLQNFKEFMAELLVNKNFRDKISGVMAKDKEEFKDKVYKYNQTLSNDIITTLVNYVQKVIKDLLDKWGQGIDFNKSMLDNATDLATKAFFKTQNSGQLSVGGPNIDGDTRKSIANMLGVLSDAEISNVLQEEKGLSEVEAIRLIEDVKFDPALNPTMEDIVGETEEGERARGLAKTFPARNIDTVVKINEEAKKYFQISNKQTAEEARAYTEGKNPEDVLDYLLTQPTDIPPRVRVWMSGAAMDNIDIEINKAQLAGDTERAARLSEKQAQLINQIAPLGTELGQAIQAFRRFYENAKGSPSMLEYFTKNILTKVEKEKGSPLTEKQREDIVKLAKDLQQAKEGLPKDEATYALANYVGTITPVRPTDILEAIWYAHILSGITTQSTNFFANLWNTFAEGSVTGIRESIKAKSPAPFLYAMKGFLNGVRVGFIEGADILKTGLAAQDADKYKETNLLEYFSWTQTKLGKLLGGKVGKAMDYAGGLSPKALKYVGRALAATDAAFSRSNTEAMARMMAYNIAKEEGKTNPDMKIRKRVDEILNNTPENVAAAKEQATKEGYVEGSRRHKRRVYEIMEQGRDKNLTNQAEDYGTRVTLNYEPEGFTRPLYKLALAMQKSTKVTKMFIPFTRIIINLTENSLNYAGAGYWKAITGSTSSESGRRKLTPDERADFAIKASIGVGTYILLSGLTGDDEDDLFEITGNGTGDIQKNFELMKSGWRPYSIKLKDGRYISYKDWPIMPVLASIGAQHDAAKYVDSKEPTPQSKIAMAGFVNSLWDKSVMKGLQDMLEIISPKQEYNQSSNIGDRLISWGSDQAKSVGISNFTQQTIKMINEYGDNPIKAAKGVERLYRDIPYLNDGLNPILDVFGEPVTPKTSEKLLPVTVGVPSKDEILSVFNENGVFIGKPQERTILLDDGSSRPMTDQEYYEFTKLSGKITKRLIQEEWADAAEILAIKDKKERRKTLAKWSGNIVSGARAEAMGELFYK
jgi:hypothetical protein